MRETRDQCRALPAAKAPLLQAPVLAAAVGCLLLLGCAGPASREHAAGRPAAAAQGIRGTLTFEGKPLRDAYVYAYRRYSSNLLGPADFASNPSAGDGSYAVDLAEGSYWIVARKRVSGENSGPLAMGDLYGESPSNPVGVREGGWTAVDLDLEQLRDPMFFQVRSRQESPQGVRGTILDEEGRPAGWAFAMAYSTPDMRRVPEYTSLMTRADGQFVIYLPRGGRYWIAARKNIREKPVPGEPFGLFRGSPDHSLEVTGGSFVEGLTIRLERYRKGMLD